MVAPNRRIAFLYLSHYLQTQCRTRFQQQTVASSAADAVELSEEIFPEVKRIKTGANSSSVVANCNNVQIPPVPIAKTEHARDIDIDPKDKLQKYRRELRQAMIESPFFRPYIKKEIIEAQEINDALNEFECDIDIDIDADDYEPKRKDDRELDESDGDDSEFGDDQ